MKSNKETLIELVQFLCLLDFEKIDDETIKIVENRFKLSELPETVRDYIDRYFNKIKLIK